MADYDSIEEKIPPFTRRVGDNISHGSNNVIVIMGTDRAKKGPATISDGQGVGGEKGVKSGTYHVIVGRQDEKGNPDFEKDLSFLYLSMKTDSDANLGTDAVESSSGILPAGIMKSDVIRLVARKDVKIWIDGSKSYVFLNAESCVIKLGSSFIKMTDGKIVIDGDDIQLGEGATEKMVKGDAFMQLYMQHSHICAVGSSTPPVTPMTAAQHLSTRTVTVK